MRLEITIFDATDAFLNTLAILDSDFNWLSYKSEAHVVRDKQKSKCQISVFGNIIDLSKLKSKIWHEYIMDVVGENTGGRHIDMKFEEIS